MTATRFRLELLPKAIKFSIWNYHAYIKLYWCIYVRAVCKRCILWIVTNEFYILHHWIIYETGISCIKYWWIQNNARCFFFSNFAHSLICFNFSLKKLNIPKPSLFCIIANKKLYSEYICICTFRLKHSVFMFCIRKTHPFYIMIIVIIKHWFWNLDYH